jgi:hypothetical protein
MDLKLSLAMHGCFVLFGIELHLVVFEIFEHLLVSDQS